MNRIASEDLLDDVLTRYEYPKKRLVRVYAYGINPVEPNPFKFAVVASIYEDGVGVIKGLSNPDDLLSSDMKAGYEHLKPFGVTELWWRHKGIWRVFKG